VLNSARHQNDTGPSQICLIRSCGLKPPGYCESFSLSKKRNKMRARPKPWPRSSSIAASRRVCRASGKTGTCYNQYYRHPRARIWPLPRLALRVRRDGRAVYPDAEEPCVTGVAGACPSATNGTGTCSNRQLESDCAGLDSCWPEALVEAGQKSLLQPDLTL